MGTVSIKRDPPMNLCYKDYRIYKQSSLVKYHFFTVTKILEPEKLLKDFVIGIANSLKYLPFLHVGSL